MAEMRSQTLAEMRQSAGLTQAEVGRRAGWSRSKVSRVERSKDPWLSELQRYMSALGMTLEIDLISPHGNRIRIDVKPMRRTKSR